MRATAQVDEIAFAIQRNGLIGRNRLNQLSLVLFAQIKEELDGIVTLPFLAADGDILLRELGHALFDRHQIFRRKGARIGKVIIKAIFNDRPDGDLGIREQLLDGIRQQMGRGVTDNVEPFPILLGQDGKIRILADHMGSIHDAAIHLAGQSGLGKTCTNRSSHLRHGNRGVEAAN